MPEQITAFNNILHYFLPYYMIFKYLSSSSNSRVAQIWRRYYTKGSTLTSIPARLSYMSARSSNRKSVRRFPSYEKRQHKYYFCLITCGTVRLVEKVYQT
jgi:hypothetical protein